MTRGMSVVRLFINTLPENLDSSLQQSKYCSYTQPTPRDPGLSSRDNMVLFIEVATVYFRLVE